VLCQQVLGDFDNISTGQTGAEKDGQQLGVGQRASPAGQQLLAGAIAAWPTLEAAECCSSCGSHRRMIACRTRGGQTANRVRLRRIEMANTL
jgi:hypothetical protein